MIDQTNIERRVVPEYRAIGRVLEGHAAVFDMEAQIADFREVIRPGAFARTLAERRDVVGLADHDKTRLLARTRTGSLTLKEDDAGLAFRLSVPETQAGRDVLELAQRGDLGGMSFGFTVSEGGERWEGRRRELRAVDLHEISVVSAWPAYEGTTVAARSHCLHGVRLKLARLFLETA